MKKWKRRMAAEAKKQKKAAANALKNKDKKKVEEIKDPNKYYENRVQMVETMTANGQEAYPHKFEISISVPEFKKRYDYLADSVRDESITEALAGRVMKIRSYGKKLKFYDLHADGSSMQVVCSLGDVPNKDMEVFRKTHENIRRGDIVGFAGNPYRTRTGELSLQAVTVQVLTPCLRMLPDQHVGLKDPETRYRKRYLDMIVNQERARKIFTTRAKIISYVRRYLDARGFLEVETPILNQIHGGATARPFLTKHNELNLPMYMRIAPELYLKKLVCGGFDRVYEIGRLFRNEGIDLTHNPEFTTCEFYWAYKDYKDLMQATEEMVSGLVFQLFGSYKVEYHPDPNDPEKVQIINFEAPWRRFDMILDLEKSAKFKIPTPYESDECNVFLVQKCKELEIEVSNPKTTSRMLDKLVEHYLEDQCQDPAFITCHPQIMSPLAKYHRSRPGLTERFEGFVLGKEICNAYTELNNPLIQRKLFKMQSEDAAKGDNEAMPVDESFCEALEYGLPPTAGWGMGIDRLTMFLTDSVNIKEVLLFPQNKPETEEEAEALRVAAKKFETAV